MTAKPDDGDALNGRATHNALAGGAAAFSVLTVFFPIDTLKTHMQTHGQGAPAALRIIIGGGGTPALYRGFSMAVTEHTINRMLLFGGSTLIKQRCTPTAWPEPLRDAAGGMGAGLGKTILLHPLDTIKVRWQLGQPGRPAEQKAAGGFVSGLYRGITPAVTRSSVGMAIWLTARNGLEAGLPAQTPLRHFVAGFLASTTNDLCTFPLDTLKKNLQSVRAAGIGAGAAPAAAASSGDLLQVAQRLWREGGVLRFYRGITPQLVRRGLDGGLLNIFYVRFKRMLEAR